MCFKNNDSIIHFKIILKIHETISNLMLIMLTCYIFLISLLIISRKNSITLTLLTVSSRYTVWILKMSSVSIHVLIFIDPLFCWIVIICVLILNYYLIHHLYFICSSYKLAIVPNSIAEERLINRLSWNCGQFKETNKK